MNNRDDNQRVNECVNNCSDDQVDGECEGEWQLAGSTSTTTNRSNAQWKESLL